MARKGSDLRHDYEGPDSTPLFNASEATNSENWKNAMQCPLGTVLSDDEAARHCILDSIQAFPLIIPIPVLSSCDIGPTAILLDCG
jgi:hypothetical protein